MLLTACMHAALAQQVAGPEAPALAQAEIEPGSEASFDILEYQVEGNTVLSAIPIEQAVYPFLGEKKSIKDVEQARQSLEKTYHEAGYLTVLVDIPEQEVKSGLVRLRVTESNVSRLKVSGSRYYSLGWIKQQVPALAEGSVPYFPDVQQQLAQLARSPDRQVAPVLRAGRAPGSVEVELKVQDQLPLHGSIEANNRYSANTTHSRLVGSLRYDNLWQRQHSISLLYQMAPEKPQESSVASSTYVIPGEGGSAYAMYAVHSSSDTAAVSGFSALGKGNYYGLRWIKPLRVRGEGYTHTFTLGVDYKSSLESVVGGADRIDTPITYMPYVAQYGGVLHWDDKAYTQFDVAANFHLRGSRSNEDEFANKRYNAQANYFYLRGSVSHTQPLGKWSLFAKVGGQAASGPLISNEQYSAGGVDTVRGYLEAEALGDYGVLGTLELRTPSLLERGHGVDQLYALAFVDGARLRLMSALDEQASKFVLSSAGLGIRVEGVKGLRLNLDWALPLKSLGTTTQARDARVHAKLAYEF